MLMARVGSCLVIALVTAGCGDQVATGADEAASTLPRARGDQTVAALDVPGPGQAQSRGSRCASRRWASPESADERRRNDSRWSRCQRDRHPRVRGDRAARRLVAGWLPGVLNLIQQARRS